MMRRNHATHALAPSASPVFPSIVSTSTIDVPALVRRSRLFALLWPLVLIGVAIGVQAVVGAYRADMGNYSDESAHFMNAMVLRDYLVHGLGQNPLAFAESYYLSYPKLAPLVWPPLFHVVLGLLLLPGWSPHTAALLFVAALSGATAYRLSRFMALFSTNFAARLVPLAFLLVPLIVDVESAVMVDIATAATALEATWWLSRYFVEQRLRDAVLFGFWAACCCLTKGNGVAIVLVPLIALVATRRFDLLMRSGLYVSAALVTVLAGPFVYISYRISAGMGDFTAGTPLDATGRFTFFTMLLWRELTPLVAVPAIIGAFAAIHDAWTLPRSARTVAPALLVALAAAGWMFHIALPLQYPSDRYIAMSIAPLLGLVPVGAAAFLRAIDWRGSHLRATTAIVTVAITAMCLTHRALPTRQSLGFRQTVAALSERDDLAGARLLVVSDELGEGAFVGEVALRRLSPPATVIRASKFLTDEDWMGNHRQLLFGQPQETLKELQDLHVEYVVFDMSRESQHTPYWSHVREMLDLARAEAPPVYTTDSLAGADVRSVGRPLTAYRIVRQSPGPAKKLRVRLRYPVGRVVTK